MSPKTWPQRSNAPGEQKVILIPLLTGDMPYYIYDSWNLVCIKKVHTVYLNIVYLYLFMYEFIYNLNNFHTYYISRFSTKYKKRLEKGLKFKLSSFS